jgi:hypothetical protein
MKKITIDENFVNNDKLSVNAKFLYIIMNLNNKDGVIEVKTMCALINKSTDTVYLILKELIDYGLVEKIKQMNENGRFGSVKYKINDFFDNGSNNIILNLRKAKTYIMYDPDLNLYKIGKTININQRKLALKIKHKNILCLYFCEMDIESFVHKFHSRKRIKKEWFDLNEEDIKELLIKFNFKPYNYEI